MGKLETIDRDFELLFPMYNLTAPVSSNMKFNSHSLQTDYEVVRSYFGGVRSDLIFKLYCYYELDYIAFGYDPPWAALGIDPPTMSCLKNDEIIQKMS